MSIKYISSKKFELPFVQTDMEVVVSGEVPFLVLECNEFIENPFQDSFKPVVYPTCVGKVEVVCPGCYEQIEFSDHSHPSLYFV